MSLTIIGVVAAITLPSLTGNINERTWNTQRKALYARFSQAIALMPALNGYGTLIEGSDSTSAVDTAAETFVTEGLSKVLKINNICDSEHLADCGIPAKITALNGRIAYSTFPKTLLEFNQSFDYSLSADWGNFSYKQPDTKAAAFETANGESIAVFYYPRCQPRTEGAGYYVAPKMCANFIYDLNGAKGPNTVGKDIGFITAVYPSDSVVVAPLPTPAIVGMTTQRLAARMCTNFNAETRLPNNEELMSLFYNKPLLGPDYYDIWSNTISTNINLGYSMQLKTGIMNLRARGMTDNVICIMR